MSTHKELSWCDVTSGLSFDCNDNGIPDECEPDLDGPVVTQQPADQEAEPGPPVLFSVMVDAALPEYQWRKVLRNRMFEMAIAEAEPLQE